MLENRVAICSYQFAKAKKTDIASVAWDLVILDEVHRLRNIFKGANKTAAAIAEALEPRQKLLRTATPLQNTRMELYGLVRIIDTKVFGGAKSFRLQYVQTNNETQRNLVLRERLNPCASARFASRWPRKRHRSAGTSRREAGTPAGRRRCSD